MKQCPTVSASTLISGAEFTANGVLGIMDSVAREIDPVRILHQGKYVLHDSCGRPEQDDRC
jgi:hypothetical protein